MAEVTVNPGSGRRAWRRTSLLWRLVTSYVALVVLALVLVAGMLVGELNSFFTQQTRDELALRARLLAANIDRRPDQAVDLIRAGSETLQVRVRLIDVDGSATIDSRDLTTAVAPRTAGLAPDTMVVSTTCLLGYLELSEPLTYRAASLAAVRHDLFVLGVGAATAAALVGLLLGRGLTSPLRRLIAATERLRAGQLEVRLPATGGDEIAQLSRAFTAMAERLAQSFATIAADRDRLRTFVADVSHELRTPITALRTFNDLLLQGAQDDPAIRQEFLAESATQIGRLDWLAQNLLDLSKLESGLVAMKIVSADLRETVAQALIVQGPGAEARQIGLQLEEPVGPLIVHHDPPRLEQAIGNLINNAIKFSPPGSTVRVRVEARDGAAHVVVADQGAGIAARDLPHIFERFYRGTASTAGTSGSGLGLAIVKSIVDAHGGHVAVDSTPGTGTTFDLSLPRSSANQLPGGETLQLTRATEP